IKVLDLMLNNEHTQIKGLRKILAIKTSMNLGLSEELKVAFPDNIPVTRPKVEDQEIKDPNWFSGFTSGEGCFIVVIQKSPTIKTGFSVSLRFQLTQHNRDLELMQSLIKFLDCGNIFEKSKQSAAIDFRIQKFKDLTEKVLPFFKEYPIKGVKHLDYLNFVKVIELMKEKEHLTEEGLNKICKIKAGMNRGRSEEDSL